MSKKKVSNQVNSKKNNFPYLEDLKKFWKYLWYGDSIGSYILNFFFAFLFIKFLFFPALGFVLNTNYPIVAIVSGSMQHKVVSNQVCDKFVNGANQDLNFTQWWDLCGSYYQSSFNMTANQFKNFSYSNGLNIGDVMILKGMKPKDIKVGDILVFIPEDRNFYLQKGPVIHRVVKKWQDANGIYHFQTKGDFNPSSIQGFETNIPQQNVLGIAVARIPYIGYAKIALNSVITKIKG